MFTFPLLGPVERKRSGALPSMVGGAGEVLLLSFGSEQAQASLEEMSTEGGLVGNTRIFPRKCPMWQKWHRLAYSLCGSPNSRLGKWADRSGLGARNRTSASSSVHLICSLLWFSSSKQRYMWSLPGLMALSTLWKPHKACQWNGAAISEAMNTRPRHPCMADSEKAVRGSQWGVRWGEEGKVIVGKEQRLKVRA